MMYGRLKHKRTHTGSASNQTFVTFLCHTCHLTASIPCAELQCKLCISPMVFLGKGMDHGRKAE